MASTTQTIQRHLRDFGIIVILVALTATFMIISPDGFGQPGNLINVVKQAAINGVIATGMMFIIISGGIDLSSGSTVAIAGVVAAMAAVKPGMPIIVPVLLALLVGAAVGFINGFGVAYAGLPSFIITLATMTGVRGAALILSGGSPIFGLPPAFEDIASSFVAGLPILVFYFLLIVLASGFVLSKTTFGRRVYAIGGNENAAMVSGINTKRYLLGVYVLGGVLAGLAGLLVASRTMQGSPTAGLGYELDAIAAVVIGGVSMTGGAGKWYGTLIGALLIAVMSSGLDIVGVNSNYQAIVKGLIIAVAVYLDLRGKKTTS